MKEYIIELREEEADELMDEHWVSELVRCNECKHHGKDTCSAGAGIAYPPPDDWYCADGEMKDAEND